MGISRKVKIIGNPIFQNDSQIDSYTFEMDRFYKQTDLTSLSAFLLLSLADESSDKVLLSCENLEDKVRLCWLINESQTLVSGKAIGQIVFENNDSSIIYNSEQFEIDINPSLEAMPRSISSASEIRQLQNELQSDIEELNEIIDSGHVNHVNGQDGDITIDCASIGAVSTTEFNDEVQKIYDGTYASFRAVCDENGDRFVNKYVKLSNCPNENWNYLGSIEPFYDNGKYSINFAINCKKLFIKIIIPENSPSLALVPCLYSKINNVNVLVSKGSTNYVQTGSAKILTYMLEFRDEKAFCERNYYSPQASDLNGVFENETQHAVTSGVIIESNYCKGFSILFNNQNTSTNIRGISCEMYGVIYNGVI